MKLKGYEFPKSSFLSVDKDINQIAEMVMKNDRIQKLLYYTVPDCLQKDNLNDDQKIELFRNNIKIIPQLSVDSKVLNYIMIQFDRFTPSRNPEFRNSILEFDIICHMDQWKLNDSGLRPFRIAGEIDSMFCDRKMSGIGTLNFLGANQLLLTEEFAGICLMYEAVHGGDDKVNAINPDEDADIIANFDKLFNN